MSEEQARQEEGNYGNQNEFFSKPVRAGKRTYFFDVKATRSNDQYLTITESKKRMNQDGKFFYEKHKIFLYKEDFEKFSEGLTEAIAYIKANSPAQENSSDGGHPHSSDVNFEDL
jgi:Protein of unknown function (DUF3276)